ncbi:leucine-rich repeat-containing G-protein coupled receptor 6-like [Mytilus edulis]|uniref:leucine-rich repeat-containing G-protein coupled receptor 6-like n=1 Tax=Mytilus edulis TaxID=6550 RepID=UPI0039F0953A
MSSTRSRFQIGCHVLWLFLLHKSYGTICPVPPPCKCTTYSGQRAYCSQLNLKSIPELVKSGGTWIIDFSNNNIETINAGAFKNVQLEQVYFSNNSISKVDDDAFSGSEKSMDVVRLDGNKLKSIPIALTKLSNLIGINIQYNPITELDETILTNLSKSLIGISFGSSSMTSWPESLQQLNNLLMLSIYNSPFSEFPDNAFKGFEKTLSFLEVIWTNFHNIPISINKLSNLNYVNFKDNHFITEIPEDAFKGLHNITTMNFEGNGIKTMPAIFKDSDKMYQVTIKSDELTDITDSRHSAKSRSKFYYLTMTNTKFVTVPIAISNMPTVTVISLVNGSIETIQSNDFKGLPALANIVLSFNPIESVNTDAFMNLPSLRYLSIDGTQLATVPEAIANTNVSWVNMNNTKIECTCSGLNWMKLWPRRLQTTIEGTCINTGTSIMNFVTSIIPTCKYEDIQ